MTVYITKYALSKGIRKAEVERTPDAPEGYVFEKGPHYLLYCSKTEWWESLEAAMQHADIMRLKKIASLRKQIAKLESLKF